MNIKKIIPCLDFEGGKVVKGQQFQNLKDVGDPVTLARYYEAEGADELVFLDISATENERKTALDYVEKIAKAITIPLCVGGGITSLEDIEHILNLGASKVSLNTAAVEDSNLIAKAAQRFGSERIVIAIDVVKKDSQWLVVTNGGKKVTALDAIKWASDVKELGAGSVLVTSKDRDGKKTGYDLELIKKIKENADLTLIASGGAGSLTDLKEGLEAGADALLAASIFHFSELSLRECKEYLAQCGFLVSAIKGLKPNYNAQGLVAAIAVDEKDGTVLMQAYMNQEAFERTLLTQRATYYSRKRQEIWVKGEKSGHFQTVKAIYLDCDRDSVLLVVEQIGVACHTGNRTCFYTPVFGSNQATIGKVLNDLQNTIKERQKNPKAGSYTNYLFSKGLDKILKKVGEESAEVIIAAKNPSLEELIYETADLLYHISVLLEAKGLNWSDIASELKRREK